MSKTAFVFPGQGSQYVGMGRDLYSSFGAAKKAFDEADSALGFAISSVSFNGPASELDKTENTQPALLAASIAALRCLEEKTGLKPDVVAGHSLGEYTALVAAGAVGFADAVRLVNKRGKFMQESVSQGTGKMSAILGLEAGVVSEICAKASSPGCVVVPANINSPQQIVVSGHSAAVEKAEELARLAGAKRVIGLSVSAPSHSPLMQAASVRLATELKKLSFGPLSIPVVTNVEAAPTTDSSPLPELLTRQLTSPVRWVESIKRMKTDGVSRIIEVGPGKILAGLIKRIEPDVECLNVDTVQDIDRVAARI